MKTRVLLLASFLIVGAGCGNKGEGKNQAAPPTPHVVQIEHIETGAQRIRSSEFLRERPKLNQIVRSSNLNLTHFKLKFRGRGFFTLEAYSIHGSIALEFGFARRVYAHHGHDRLLLANIGEVLPYRNAQGDLCANVLLNATLARPAMTVAACEQRENDDYYNDRRSRNRSRY